MEKYTIDIKKQKENLMYEILANWLPCKWYFGEKKCRFKVEMPCALLGTESDSLTPSSKRAAAFPSHCSEQPDAFASISQGRRALDKRYLPLVAFLLEWFSVLIKGQ
jgi:hypothetical protein